MRLEVGDAAPNFELEDAAGKTWRLEDLRGKKVILFFYPVDDTPGCTIEACDFRDSYEEFTAAGYVILGASPQGADSKRAFTEKYGLNFPLLIDSDGDAAKAYGVWEERGDYEGAPLLLHRSTFVIDEDGRIEEAMCGVKARGHVEKVRDLLLASR